MAPLVGYDSSDEDEESQQVETGQETPEDHVEPPTVAQPPSPALAPEAVSSSSAQEQGPPPGPSLPPASAPAAMGPSLPPADAGEGSSYPEEADMDMDPQAALDGPSEQPPSSPYTANRTLIHNLTLPTVPNLDMPSSPPPSPSQSAAQAALTAKFDKFLELKRKKGVHFNAKIADSHALMNPPLMDKLLGFAGISTDFGDGEGTEQYETTLDKELWDPSSFPEWAYRVPLRKAQERQQKEKGRERGEAVQFVPAT